MYFEKCDIPDKKMAYRFSDNLKLLTQFAEANIPCAEVKDYSQKEAYNCAASLRNSIRRYGLTNIVARAYANKVYLLRKDLVPELKDV